MKPSAPSDKVCKLCLQEILSILRSAPSLNKKNNEIFGHFSVPYFSKSNMSFPGLFSMSGVVLDCLIFIMNSNLPNSCPFPNLNFNPISCYLSKFFKLSPQFFITYYFTLPFTFNEFSHVPVHGNNDPDPYCLFFPRLAPIN